MLDRESRYDIIYREAAATPDAETITKGWPQTGWQQAGRTVARPGYHTGGRAFSSASPTKIGLARAQGVIA